MKMIKQQQFVKIAGGITFEQIEKINNFHKKFNALIRKSNKFCNVTQYVSDHNACLPEDYELSMVSWKFIQNNLINYLEELKNPED